MSTIGASLNVAADLVLVLIHSGDAEHVVVAETALDAACAHFDGPPVVSITALDAPSGGDAAAWTALRVCLEATGAVPGVSEAACRVLLNAVEGGEGLAEACEALGVLPDLGAVRRVGELPRAHGGLSLGTVVVAEVRCSQVGSGDDLLHGELVSRGELHRQWMAGESTLPDVLAGSRADWLVEADGIGLCRRDAVPEGVFSWVRGIRWIPLLTPTLPPATHTNCFVLGTDALTVVDPGSSDPVEQRRLEALLDTLCADGAQVARVLVTHEHSDHVRGVSWFVSHGIPVWAPEHAHVDFPVARWLSGGEVFGDGVGRFEVVHTPGHVEGHIGLRHVASGGFVAGDLVAALGTIVVSPPDGHMGDYFRSLRRVRSLQPSLVYPSHGPVIADPTGHLDAYLAHRQGREDSILAAFSGAMTPSDLVAVVYADVPRHVWPLAERNVVAHLQKLEEEGRVVSRGDHYVVGSDPESSP